MICGAVMTSPWKNLNRVASLRSEVRVELCPENRALIISSPYLDKGRGREGEGREMEGGGKGGRRGEGEGVGEREA